MAAIIMIMLRSRLPLGSLTLLITGNSILMFLMAWRYSHVQWPVLIAALVGGTLADVLLNILQPSAQRVKALRWFSFLTPAVLFLTYFVTLLITDHVWWHSNMWLGMIFFSGILGLGLSWLAVSPYEPDAASNVEVKTGP